MVDPESAEQAIQSYVRPQSFPVAVRMLRPGERAPGEARRPSEDLRRFFTPCRAIDLARRHGWTLALNREDSLCALGNGALGFGSPSASGGPPPLCEGVYAGGAAARAQAVAAADRFSPGEYWALLVAPLARCTFEPDLVVVYATPAQVMRLVQAALWKRGGKLVSSFGCRMDCSEIIVTTMKSQECQVILPGTGDRVFGRTQDDEMAFSIPWGRMPEILEGLQGTHRSGIRYPVVPSTEGELPVAPL